MSASRLRRVLGALGFRGLERSVARIVYRSGGRRRVTVDGGASSDRFILVVALMVVFFAGLVALQVSYMLVFREWNEAVFNGIMLIVGTIVGSVWGRSQA